MEVLSPRSANVPMKAQADMKKTKAEPRKKGVEKIQNPDKIEDRWRPADVVREPGSEGDAYITGRKLGKGGFAVCFEGRSQTSSEIYALKVVKSHVEQKKQLEKFRTELQIHAKMRHPHVVEFYRAFSFEKHTYVVLELCPNGSLMEMVKSRGSLSLPEVRRYMIQLCGGVKYMHRRCVIHRDLKMGNIFLDSHMDVKIGDFGLAAVVLDEKDRRQTLCGTPNYIAPEILNKSGGNGHDNKVDTWAVGIICYAMLIGSPPFASKTQAEIYSKLKLLQYDWKETDSQNFIPLQAKQLVGSCLNLNGTERPEMDDLVEHEFFKMGAIADELDPTCRTSQPTWLESADPRGDKVRPGYGVEYSRICQSSGVGRTPSGKPRPSVGENMNKSAMTEVELENAQGCAPVIPLPDGVIYQQFTAARKEWASTRKFPVRAAVAKGRELPAQAVPAPDIPGTTQPAEHVDVAPPPSGPILHGPLGAPVPRQPVQSFAAQQRERALPTRSVSSKANPVGDRQLPGLLNGDGHDVPTSGGYLRERPVRAPSTRSTGGNSARDATVDTQPSLPRSRTISGAMSRTVGARLDLEAADSLSREKPATMGRSVSHRILPTRTSSPSPEPREVHLTRATSASLCREMASGILKPTTRKDRHPVDNRGETSLEPGEASMPRSRARPRLLSASDPSSTVRDSTPSAVVASLRRLHESLSPPTTPSAAKGQPSSVRQSNHAPHAVVEKWVDYTNKYGIAYILSDSTVGVVLKSSDDGAKASSCVVIRNSRMFYTRRSRKREGQIVPQDAGATPVEFYEQCGDEGMKTVRVPARRYRLDVEKHGGNTGQATSELAERFRKESGGSAEAERLRLVVLADKFGKYMTKTLGNEEVDDGGDVKSSGSPNFVNFYQRLGNVGVWGYGGGGFQFNFPDHTKAVVYERQSPEGSPEATPEFLLDLYYLQTADAVHLAKHGSFKAKALERRNLVTLGVRDVLADGIAADLRMRRKGYPDILASNEVKEKLAWIRGVVGCWIREGGVGKMGGEKVGWMGLQETGDDKKAKLVWVSVGRAGGDGDEAA